VYFDLSSVTVTAETITSRLGIQPDETSVRASRRAEPPIPTRHHWSVRCRERGLCVDDQITRVLGRIEPVRTKILDLISGGEVFARLQIVRNFDDESGEEEVLDSFVTPGGDIAEKVPGQHQLLGWILSADQVAVLASMRATIDSDEYG
jgi:hypothetical protein